MGGVRGGTEDAKEEENDRRLPVPVITSKLLVGITQLKWL